MKKRREIFLGPIRETAMRDYRSSATILDLLERIDTQQKSMDGLGKRIMEIANERDELKFERDQLRDDNATLGIINGQLHVANQSLVAERDKLTMTNGTLIGVNKCLRSDLSKQPFAAELAKVCDAIAGVAYLEISIRVPDHCLSYRIDRDNGIGCEWWPTIEQAIEEATG